MRIQVRDVSSYFKAIFLEGQKRFLTLFDILGVILFFWPNLAEVLIKDFRLSRMIGAILFFLSFTLANFATYRKIISELSSFYSISEDSLLMYPYANPPYNPIEMQYVGEETIKDLNIKIIYKDQNGVEKEKEILQFFPENDYLMALHSPRLNVLVPRQIARFHLVNQESTLDKKVKISAEFTGTRSGKHITLVREFNLDEKPSVQIF